MVYMEVIKLAIVIYWVNPLLLRSDKSEVRPTLTSHFKSSSPALVSLSPQVTLEEPLTATALFHQETACEAARSHLI